MRSRVTTACVLALMLGCQRPPEQPTPVALPDGVKTASAAASDVPPAPPEGLTMTLFDAHPPPPPRPPAPPAEPLDAAETARLLARLPRPASPASVPRFAFPPETLPPPEPGTVLPLEAGRERPAPAVLPNEPLTVVRHAPEGEVPIAPRLSVTFSQPMVALGAPLTETPVRLSPQPSGQWRWLGTSTLLFEPTVRFPMATVYEINLPPGLRSQSGAALGTAVQWTFATPAPRLLASYPEGASQPLTPLFFARFDQRIDPGAVLATIVLDPEVPLRLATSSEIAADADVRAFVAESEDGRWLAFRPTQPLPGATRVTVTVGPGTPSAEGPRTTAEPQRWELETHGPLELVDVRCGHRGTCEPLLPWRVRFSNALAEDQPLAALVHVEPPLAELEVDGAGETLVVRGLARGSTRYQVRFDAGLRDIYGQRLAGEREVDVDVGPAPHALWGPRERMIVLDPHAGPELAVMTTNQRELRVRASRVTPEHWGAFTAWLRASQEEGADPELPGTPALGTTVFPAALPDALVDVRVALGPALRQGLGQLVLEIVPSDVEDENPVGEPAIRAWIQATRIGLAAFADARELLVWVTDLATGTPRAGVALRLEPGGADAVSGADGLAVFSLPADETQAELLVARAGDDLALLPHDLWSRSGWARQEPTAAARWYVFDDRHLYKPGEDARIKGFVRVADLGEGGDLRAAPKTAVRWALTDSDGRDLGKGTSAVSALGGFDAQLHLPANAGLGPASLRLTLSGAKGIDGTEHLHALQVQEFRTPEFEVTTAAQTPPFLAGASAVVTAHAAYYAGGGLPGAEVSWNVSATPARYTPPGRDDFAFGPAEPWLFWYRPAHEEQRSERHTGVTDAGGEHHLGIRFDALAQPRPMQVTAEATVTDVNRQAWAAASELLVHPAALYVGLRSDKGFMRGGEPITVDAIVTDLDGAAVPGRPVQLALQRIDREQAAGPACDLLSTREPVRCELAPQRGGLYRVSARVTDDAGRANESQLIVWVSGAPLPESRELSEETVVLLPDRKEYAAGTTAEVLVQAPFFPAEGLLTLRRSGIVHSERFRMDSPSHVLAVALTEAHVPNVIVQVDLVGEAAREGGGPARAAFASGNVNLAVPPRSRTLGVTAVAEQPELEPGADTAVTVEVRDASGDPVAGAEVALVVADEAVLALAGASTPDPLAVFYEDRPAGASDHHLRASVVLADTLLRALLEDRSMYFASSLATNGHHLKSAMRTMELSGLDIGGSMRGLGASDEPIRVRKDFAPLALFAPALRTGPDGRARVPLHLPDSLTRWRITAVAAHGERAFGRGESTLTARLPLMVRPSPPRFVNTGDRFELPVVVHNQTGADLRADVALRVTGLTLSDPAGRRVTVPANDRVELRFATAADHPGSARLEVAAAAGDRADAAELKLPVYTPASTEAAAAYGELDQGAAAVPVQLPVNALSGFGGIEIDTASTALHALGDAVLFLSQYPYRCTEQLASGVLAVAALRDVLAAFDGLPPPAELRERVQADLAELAARQNPDGSFGFWARGGEPWPYVGVHVAHAFERARAKGFAVPAEALERSRRYLRGVERELPSHYARDARAAITAYALYVRALGGDRDLRRARALSQEDALPLEAAGWLLAVLGTDPKAGPLLRLLNNRASETESSAHFATSYGDGERLVLHSDRRADAVVLEGLLTAAPKHALLPKLVRGLLGHRRSGHWQTTQDNAFVLLALGRYFEVAEREVPRFTARAWVGERYAGSARFEGRTLEHRRLEVPLDQLQATQVVVDKQGPGRLYWRVGLRWAPANLKEEPLAHGFEVERSYEGLRDPADVRQDPEDRSWHIRAGAEVRVRIRFVTPSRRAHVALADPLPAGLEPVNPLFAPSPQGPREHGESWFDHQSLRDERAEAFAAWLWEGVHAYDYVARATTPGRFVVPPTTLEEMYHPETSGRGRTDLVVVE